MKKIFIIVLLFVVTTLNTYAFDLVKAEDTTKYSLGLEYGSLLGGDGIGYYFGLSGSFKMSDKSYIKTVIGKTTDLANDEMKLLVLAKPMYCFQKDMGSKSYVFGILGNFKNDLSLGVGLGYEMGRVFGEISYTTDEYVSLSTGYIVYF